MSHIRINTVRHDVIILVHVDVAHRAMRTICCVPLIATVGCERSGTARKGRETEGKAVITAFKSMTVAMRTICCVPD
eukprot:SAG22_NODE_1511_length_4257_cov_10.774651_4_plen_77_part_00